MSSLRNHTAICNPESLRKAFWFQIFCFADVDILQSNHALSTVLGKGSGLHAGQILIFSFHHNGQVCLRAKELFFQTRHKPPRPQDSKAAYVQSRNGIKTRTRGIEYPVHGGCVGCHLFTGLVALLGCKAKLMQARLGWCQLCIPAGGDCFSD